MSRYYDRYYDHWERLVGAVIRREQLRQLSLDDSTSTSTRSFDSDFSRFSSNDPSFDPSPLHTRFTPKRDPRDKKNGKIRNIWKGLSIFRRLSSKEYEKDERDIRWSTSQRTLHGHEAMRIKIPSFEEIPQSKDEIARLQEVYTLKGHIESVMKLKGLDIDSIPHNYTI